MMRQRQQLYTLLAVGKKQLAWDDEFYRDVFLKGHGAKLQKGKYSASTMAVWELENALKQMMHAGFKPKPKTKSVHAAKPDWRTPRIKKITAMWLDLANRGAIKNRSEQAMVAWCKSFTGMQRLEWANSADLNKCIEGLKSWCGRESLT